MTRWRLTARCFFGIVFALGCVAHLAQGRVAPEGYAAFGHTALPPLAWLWWVFVMPNIGPLTIALAALELTIGICLLRGGRPSRWAAVVVLGFFCFLLVLGYGWPTASPAEDFAKNRLGTLVMAAFIAPVAWGGGPPRARSAPLG